MNKEIESIRFEYGAMSSKYAVYAYNKLTAYCAMYIHFGNVANLIMLYEPKDIVKQDVWTCFDKGTFSERLDEIFGGPGSFERYLETHNDEIQEAMKSIVKLV